MASIKTIQRDFAVAVKRETGADVEITIIAANKFSVFALSEKAIATAHNLISQVPGVVLEDQVIYTDEETEYYNYYTHSS